ncbi:hypothetical protein ACIRPH_31670 [Nocardiopsis sp. NPDC101807]|uniref:hypothetical protein n=1 Tax=Nocardiopsis sp. NPDC101807 TaxID=3364339 RepID=UPI00382FE6D5
MTTPEDPKVPISEYIAEMRSELARVDTKAGLLAGLSGASLALLAPQLDGDDPAVWVIRAGAAALVAALVVMLLGVRPRISRTAPFAALLADPTGWTPEGERERALALAAVTASKFRRIRLAVDLLIGAAVLVGAGLLWAGIAG